MVSVLQWSHGMITATHQFISFFKSSSFIRTCPLLKMQGEWISPELDKNGNPPDIIAIGLQVVLLTSDGFGSITFQHQILFLFSTAREPTPGHSLSFLGIS